MRSLDDVFELFSEERRRFALYYLEERDDKVPVSELAETIESWEDDPDRAGITGDRYRDIVIELQHEDLPKADEVEFVEYDSEDGVIELTDEPREFQLILTVAEAIEQPESEGDGISARL